MPYEGEIEQFAREPSSRMNNTAALGQTRPLSLAAVGREPPDAAAVWKHGAADGRAPAAGWIRARGWGK